MKQLVGLIFLLSIASFSPLLAQNKDTTLVSITNFRLDPGTFSWRGTGTFHDMTSWNSSQYTEGNLKQKSGSNWVFRMNYRLLFPVGYDTNFDKGYPLIVMLHGGGERGNCWNGSCYCTDCLPNNTPVPDADPRFLNNDHVLLHGGQPHLTAVNLAGTKKPDDPTLNPRAFPGFVLFPQNENTWGSATASNSALSYAIRVIRLAVKKYNIDPDRIYIHGLSLGGQAVYKALNMADWLFAAAAPMSALVYSNDLEYDSVANIPLWAFQGGKDTEPNPGQTETLVRKYREAGGNARYTLYPTLSHGTWNTAYNEPDFFTWLLSKRKSDLHVYYDNPKICGTNGAGAKLGLAQGFPAYQWERDGQIIPGANSHIYIATIPGVYRARFSRESANPTEEQWNEWSQTVTVSEQMPEQPQLHQIGSVMLRDLNNFNSINLKTEDGFAYYYWYKNGVLSTLPSNDTATFNSGDCTGNCVNNGTYTVVTAGFDKCPSPPSEPKYVFFTNQAPATIPKPTGFAGTLTAPTSILLTWSDVSAQERGYEIWRRRSTDLSGNGWTMVTLTKEDITSYHDTGLEPNVQYWYKIRAVSNTARSTYAPGDSKTLVAQNLIISTVSDVTAPTAPQNLTAIQSDINITNRTNSITLTWEASTDDGTIDEYIIHYGSAAIHTGSTDTSYVVSGLAVNAVYNFTVEATDLAGNTSEPSNQATEDTYVDGLYYEHSTGAWTSVSTTDFSNAEFKGKVTQFTLSPATQDDFYNFRFYGYFYITTAGNYTFRLEANDGARLYVDGVLRIDRNGTTSDGTCGGTTTSNISITAGAHTIEVRYFESTGSECLNVFYRGADTNNATIAFPANKLRSYNTITTPATPTAPANLTATANGMTQIDASWTYPGQNPAGLKVVVLGSSTAVGTGASPTSNGWVGLLTSWLSSTTTGSSVTNLAVGGYTTNSVLPSVNPNNNITKALSLNPHIILVNLPSNDVNSGIPIATTMNNFRTLKSLADAQGVMIFFTTTQPRNFPELNLRDSLQVTANLMRTEFGEYIIDIYDELTDFSNDKQIKTVYGSGDGIHLNNAGHNYIFTTARDKLLPYLTNFELYSATSASGPFAMIARTNALSYQHQNLTPGTTYYYKLRTVNVNGVSAFTSVVSATTATDTQAPTQPTGLMVTSSSFTNVALVWTQSTDNTRVIGYEIWANGVLIGTSSIPGYQATNLIPNTSYSFYVVAYDANDNKSTPSNTVVQVTSTPDTYYSKAAGNLNQVSSWGKQTDGSGDAPADFSTNGLYLIVSNRTTSSLGGSWNVEGTISKVIISDGVTLTADNPFTGRVEIPGTGSLILSHASVPEMISLSPSSTVTYNSAAAFVQQNTYGNLALNGTGYKTFASGTTNVTGDLTAQSGIALKGASGNGTRIVLSGDLTMNGTPGFTPADFRALLECNNNGAQTITTGGTLDLYQIKTTATASVMLANTGTAVNLRLGSAAGGGLSLANGTTLNAGNNNLELTDAATINSSGETGRIAISGGDITITSTSNLHSHLYFDPVNNSVKRLGLSLTGTGDVLVHENVKITEAIKIQSGELNAGGSITLISTATQTANIEEIENNGVITGDVNVQRHFSAKPKVYRYISTPVAGTTIADWQTAFPITGNFTGASPVSPNPSVHVYEPAGWVPYPAPGGSNQDPIEKGRGYSAYVRNTTEFTMETTGNPYQGNVTYTLNAPAGAYTGFNLLGNPYASTIAWSSEDGAWIRSAGNINSTIAVPENLNSTTIQFRYYDYVTGTGNLAGGKIAPGQSFWVQTTGAGPTMTVTEKAKVAEQQGFYREPAKTNVLRVDLKQGLKEDPTFIVFTSAGTDGFDMLYDGVKKANTGIFNFSSMAGTTSLAINNTSDSFCSKTIRLNVQNVTAGIYTLSFASLDEVEGIGQITLWDNLLDSVANLRTKPDYEFSVTADPASYGADRFVITITRPETDLTPVVQAADVCGGDLAKVSLNQSQAGAEYLLIDEQGKAISDVVTGTGEAIDLLISKDHLLTGENQVKVRAGFKGCAQSELPVSVAFTYTPRPVVNTQEYLSVCQGSTTRLTASGAPEGGSYIWYDKAGMVIAGVQDAEMQTSYIKEETQYYVAAAHANGCQGERRQITVTPEAVEVPLITLQNDTLEVVANGVIQWFVNGEAVLGGNQYRLIPQVSGVYTVTSSLGDCTLASEPLNFIITGTEHGVSGNALLALYPNPAPSDQIRIKVLSGEFTPVEVRLVDLMSKTLWSGAMEPASAREGVNLPLQQTLADGIYFVIARQGEKVQKLKLIIKN
jgi:lysophospholipase L1-like esterase/predicted esterase